MEKEYTNDLLEEQIKWYDKKSQKNQRNYKIVRVSEVIICALITISAGFEWTYTLIGLFGFMIIIFEAIQNIYQFQYLWISYRSTCDD